MTQSVLDLDSLLAPVNGGDSPSGEDLRTGAGRDVYDQIRGARNQARNREKPQMMGDPTASQEVPGEWRVVRDRCTEVIAEKSKDLELSTYLIESLVRLDGFAGLRDGFCLYKKMIEQYWDSVFPLPDEEGINVRVAAIGGLNGDATRDGALLFPIFRVPLTSGATGGYAAYQYKYALALQGMAAEKQQERVAAGHVSFEAFEAAAKASSDEFCQNLFADLQGCVREFEELSTVLGEKCGADAPPSSKIRGWLDECTTVLRSLYGDRLDGPTGAVTGGPGNQTNVEAPDRPVRRGGIDSRREALRQIREVAEFFRSTEPHSPITYALEQAVRWGELPLPQLLTELISDDTVRSQVFRLIGIRDGQNPENS